MKKFVLLCLAAALALSGCTPTIDISSEASIPDTGISLRIGESEFAVGGHNTLAGVSLFDADYRVNGELCVAYKLPQDGCVVSISFAPDEGGYKFSTAFAEKSAGDVAVIPVNGCSVFIPGASALEGEAVFTGYTVDTQNYTDLSGACVTDESGLAGFSLTHKDITAFPENDLSVGNVLIQPAVTVKLAVPDGAIGVEVKRRIKGGFQVAAYGVEKASQKNFTLILRDEYSKAFARDVIAANQTIMLVRTDTITSHGSTPALEVGELTFDVAALNPSEPIEGLCIYDEESGLALSPERGYDFVDILVFDEFVTSIGNVGERTVSPYPNGIMLCFNGSEAVEKAKGISIGDEVNEILFETVTSPMKYVLLGDKYKVEIAYRNESRTSVAYAVMYDGDYMHNSTDTNIWGAEVAVNANGEITEIVPMGENGVSGNTSIPDGGFVLSTGRSQYMAFINSVRAGYKAEYIEKQGFYFFRTVEEAIFGKYGEGEYLSIIDETLGKKVKIIADALEISVDAKGCVTAITIGSGAVVPDGGYVIVATGVKKNELLRFCEVGQTVIAQKLYGRILLLGSPDKEASNCLLQLEELEKTVTAAKAKLLPLDYAYLESGIAEVRAALAGDDLEKRAEAMDKADELCLVSFPSRSAEVRAAWVIDYDNNAEDVKHSVEYAKRLGLNTLILSPFRDGRALYNTKLPHLEKHQDLAEDVDILQLYSEECKRAGISLYFMYCCFSSLEPGAAHSEDSYVNYFADKLLLSRKGRNVAYFYDSPSYTLNPFDTEVREWSKALIAEVIENYDIDGVQLDYVRFPLPTSYGENNYEDFGYNADIRAEFESQYGADPQDIALSDPLWEKWCEFRCDIITDFVREVSELCDSAEQDLSFSCTCFADDGDRKKYVFQDMRSWVSEGLIDELYPMIYAATVGPQVRYGSEIAEIVGDKCHLVLGIGTYDGETVPVVKEQLEFAHEAKTDGNSVFALAYIQHFEFDGFYAQSAFRTPAVRTDLYGITVKAVCADLKAMLGDTCGYLYPTHNLIPALEALAELESECSDFVPDDSTSDAEKKLFCGEVIAGLEGVLEKVKSSSLPPEATGCIEAEILRCISLFVRTENTI